MAIVVPTKRNCYLVIDHNELKYFEWSETEFGGATNWMLDYCWSERNDNRYGGRW